MRINEYLNNLGLNDNEIDIFLGVFKLGSNPASTIANYLNMERTYVYKSLIKLTKLNLVYETSKGKVKHFYIPDSDVLEKFITKKIEKYNFLKEDFVNIQTELEQYKQPLYNSSIPKITIFDGNDGIENLYNDIYDNVLKNSYISIKLFSTNTLEAQTSLKFEIKENREKLFKKLGEKKVTVDTYLGNGISTMEEIVKITQIENLYNLPASNSAINIFVVGRVTYIVIYKKNPFGIKLDSEDLAWAMHFLFDKLNVN
ncbi:MAG: helix-turn-helix domain-containing protein [Candidatus Gracilibacteria bacterium]|nr:helix-turn-helix domain-containing protein [Candidatus Gracilibacteria bacterium]